MNIVFWILVLAAVVVLWAVLSSAYNSVGKFGKHLFDNVKNKLVVKEEKSEEEKENENER